MGLDIGREGGLWVVVESTGEGLGYMGRGLQWTGLDEQDSWKRSWEHSL